MTDVSRTRALSVADTLRARIFDGVIESGSHLMEVTLANELGVSRTPVRDALARLADEGLLLYVPNKGFLVRHYDLKDVRDAFTLRAELEAMGCRLVGERGLPAKTHGMLLDRLEAQKLVLHGEEWNNECAKAWQDLNLDFHLALLELADNRWLSDAVRRARQLPSVYDRRSRPSKHEFLFLLYGREHGLQALDDHFKIVGALANRETSRAGHLMREHILTNRDVLLRALLESPNQSTYESNLLSVKFPRERT